MYKSAETLANRLIPYASLPLPPASSLPRAAWRLRLWWSRVSTSSNTQEFTWLSDQTSQQIISPSTSIIKTAHFVQSVTPIASFSTAQERTWKQKCSQYSSNQAVLSILEISAVTQLMICRMFPSLQESKAQILLIPPITTLWKGSTLLMKMTRIGSGESLTTSGNAWCTSQII